MVAVAEENLMKLKDTGFTFQIIDRNAWNQPLFLVEHRQKMTLDAIPPVVEVLFKIDEVAIIEAPADVTDRLKREGYRLARTPEHPICLSQSLKRSLSDLQIVNLQDPVIGALVEKVSEASITAGIQRLQDFQTRFSASDSIYSASQWLYDQFKSYGCEDVKFDTLREPVLGKLQRNVIVTKRGTAFPDSVIVLGGHYDSVVYDGTDPMTWAPGANDNASGTIAALEMARILADIDLEATIVFACWAAEEQGLYGAWDYVQKATEQNRSIDLYIYFAMISFQDVNDRERDVTIYTDAPSWGYAELMQEMTLEYTTLVPYIRTAGGGSDHWPFMQMGYNIIYAEEGDFGTDYIWHDRRDVLDNLDMQFCTEIIRMGFANFLHLTGPIVNISGPYMACRTYSIDDDNSGKASGMETIF